VTAVTVLTGQPAYGSGKVSAPSSDQAPHRPTWARSPTLVLAWLRAFIWQY